MEIKTSVLLEVMKYCIQEPIFDTLRTKEGLGYDVSMNTTEQYGTIGWNVTVVSPAEKYTCAHIDERIETFLKKYSETIENMQQSFFEELVQSRVQAKSVPDYHLLEEVNRNWYETLNLTYKYGRLQEEIETLRRLSLKEFKKWSLDQISSRRKLSVQIVGNGGEETRKMSLSKDSSEEFKTLFGELEQKVG